MEWPEEECLIEWPLMDASEMKKGLYNKYYESDWCFERALLQVLQVQESDFPSDTYY